MDGTLLVVSALVLVLAALAWWRGGGELVRAGLVGGVGLLTRFGLVLVVSFLAAGLAEVLIPRDAIRGWLGGETGVRGILLATGAGMLTPSGPFVAFPIAAVLARSGAGAASLVAYVTGWALLALHRLVAWEVPILGARFALLRWSVSIVLPLLAGLLARALARS